MLNKHIIEAIINTVDDDQGNVVIVHEQPLAVVKQLTESLAGIAVVRWSNGHESIEIDNGSWVKVIRPSGHGRGLVANLLVLPTNLSLDKRAELAPVIATGGDVLGYLAPLLSKTPTPGEDPGQYLHPGNTPAP
ncbi:hypothetical protein [Glutamicibacter halophytocola]|uniref:hypothetical protein n=1 Tax=Glutamicibacter halophytocola TaxID=1933880 RepID=UPI001892B463|nr:hypothetical protein [Glutamicibacter halophytocola]